MVKKHLINNGEEACNYYTQQFHFHDDLIDNYNNNNNINTYKYSTIYNIHMDMI